MSKKGYKKNLERLKVRATLHHVKDGTEYYTLSYVHPEFFTHERKTAKERKNHE